MLVCCLGNLILHLPQSGQHHNPENNVILVSLLCSLLLIIINTSSAFRGGLLLVWVVLLFCGVFFSFYISPGSRVFLRAELLFAGFSFILQ